MRDAAGSETVNQLGTTSDRWVCLMYHEVALGAPTRSDEAAYFGVGRDSLGGQLDVIRNAGFRGCSIERARAICGTRRVAISFDDGYAGQFEHAFPALQERGMTATFFVTTSWIGTPGFLTWNQLREMNNAGMSIQSHTHTHPFLSELTMSRLLVELETSKEILDAQLGQQTDCIALPGGDAPKLRLQHLIGDCGYALVATSRWGVNESRQVAPATPWIARCTVRGAPSKALFMQILTADLWLTFRRRMRGGVLRTIRSSLGPSRYALWRRRLLQRGDTQLLTSHLDFGRLRREGTSTASGWDTERTCDDGTKAQ